MQFIRESELEPFLPVEGSWIGSYLNYALSRSDHHLAWVYLNALGVVATVAPVNLTIGSLPGGTQYANFWGIAVGPPAGHKTSALKMAMEVLSTVAPTRIASVSGSSEGIARSLQTPAGGRVAPIYELGSFLSTTKNAAYASTIKPMLTDLFDCMPYQRPLAGKMVNLPNPRINLLAAVNVGMLQNGAETNDWEGGFLSRFLVFNAEAERGDPTDPCDPGDFTSLVEGLRELSKRKCGPCLGLTQRGLARWKDWSTELQEATRRRVHDATGHGIFGRSPLYAMKIALLSSFDYGEAGTGDPWYVDDYALEVGIGLAELGRRCALELAALAQPSGDMQDRSRVLQILQHATHVAETDEDRWVPQWRLLRASKLLAHRFMSIVQTLLDERRIAFESGPSGNRYRYTSDEEVEQEDRETEGVATGTVTRLRDAAKKAKGVTGE